MSSEYLSVARMKNSKRQTKLKEIYQCNLCGNVFSKRCEFLTHKQQHNKHNSVKISKIKRKNKIYDKMNKKMNNYIFTERVVFGIIIPTLPKGFKALLSDDETDTESDNESNTESYNSYEYEYNLRLLSDVISNL